MTQSYLDLGGRWPELFAGLTDAQHNAVVEAFVSNWHAGWVPSREDVKNLIDLACGAIGKDEYDRRSARAAEDHTRSGLCDGAVEDEPYRHTP